MGLPAPRNFAFAIRQRPNTLYSHLIQGAKFDNARHHTWTDTSAFTVIFISRRARIPGSRSIELQDSAYPYHDWNERITAECYAPNASSRILTADNRITRIVNNYSRISFNFGPTLLSWLEDHAPDTYQAILDADTRKPAALLRTRLTPSRRCTTT